VEIVILLLLAFSLSTNNYRANFNFVISGVTALFALFGGALWNLVRASNASGLPSAFDADISVNSKARSAFLLVSLAFAVISTVPAIKTKVTLSLIQAIRFEPRQINGLSAAALIIWALGQGPSLWQRDAYLQSDGIQIIHSTTSILFPLLGCLALFALSLPFLTFKRRVPFWGTIAIGLAWSALSLAAGSRVSVLFVLTIGIFIYLRTFYQTKARLRNLFSAILVLVAVVPAALYTFRLTFQARFTSFGLRQIILGQIFDPSYLQIDGGSLVDQLANAASSFASSFPVTDLTIVSGVKFEHVIQALNPIPSGIAGFSSDAQDLVLPWLPESTIGQFYFALGPIGLFLIFLLFGSVSEIASRWFLRNGYYLEAWIPRSLLVLALLISTQYPTRLFSRLASVAIIVPITLWLIYRRKSHSNKSLNQVSTP
jgi:hypothetical protein